jgi:hypothetical protein
MTTLPCGPVTQHGAVHATSEIHLRLGAELARRDEQRSLFE